MKQALRVLLIKPNNMAVTNAVCPTDFIETSRDPSVIHAYLSQLGVQCELIDLTNTEFSNSSDSPSFPEWLYISGHDLRLMDENGFEKLLNVARGIKAAGGQVVLDPKYRPHEWSSRVEAGRVLLDCAKVCTILVSALSGQDELWGCSAADHGTIATAKHAERWFSQGVRLVVLKCGARGAEIHEPRVHVRRVTVSHPISPVDMAGAGDGFNAALIAGLYKGKTLDCSTRMANTLAGIIMRCRGPSVPGNQLARFELAQA